MFSGPDWPQVKKKGRPSYHGSHKWGWNKLLSLPEENPHDGTWNASLIKGDFVAAEIAKTKKTIGQKYFMNYGVSSLDRTLVGQHKSRRRIRLSIIPTYVGAGSGVPEDVDTREISISSIRINSRTAPHTRPTTSFLFNLFP